MRHDSEQYIWDDHFEYESLMDMLHKTGDSNNSSNINSSNINSSKRCHKTSHSSYQNSTIFLLKTRFSLKKRSRNSSNSHSLNNRRSAPSSCGENQSWKLKGQRQMSTSRSPASWAALVFAPRCH